MTEIRRCPFCSAEVGDGPHTGCGGLFRELMTSAGEVPPDVAEAEAAGAERIRQYTLVRLLGRGGMGEVWKAWDRVLARWVAMKFVPGSDEQDAARFRREARMAARLRHPNIAAVYEVGEENGRSFIAMDYIEGGTLAAAELPLDLTLEIFSAVARGVEAAHRAGVVHRDLKPQNILLSRDFWPFVTDFGLARSIAPGGTVSATGSVLGTPAYMSPEQAAGRMEDIDERSDVYSLGATFYHVLARQAPFSGEPLAILGAVVHQDPRPLRTLRPDLPAPVETIVLKAMSKAKRERYSTAADLADDLDRHLAHEKIRGRVPGPFRRFLRRARGPAAGVAIVLAGLVGAVYLDRRRARSAPEAPVAGIVETASASRETPETRLEGFLRSLAGLASEDELKAMTTERFEAAYGLPAPAAGDSAALTWARSCRGVLDRLRAGAATEHDLAINALQAGNLHPQLFATAEETAFRLLEARLAARTAGLDDAPKVEREAARAAVDDLFRRWRAFFSLIPGDVRALHPALQGQERRMDSVLDRFPLDPPVLEGVDLLACLRAGDPEMELARAERDLKSRLGQPRLSLESRQRLLTAIVVAAAHRALLEGRTEDDAADGLKEYGPRLAAVGGPGDLGVYSPRIRRVADALMRKWGQR